MDLGIGEERMRCMERVTWKLTLPYVKYISNRNLLAQETQTGALYQPRGVGMGRKMEGRLKTEGIHVYLWLINVEV